MKKFMFPVVVVVLVSATTLMWMKVVALTRADSLIQFQAQKAVTTELQSLRAEVTALQAEVADLKDGAEALKLERYGFGFSGVKSQIDYLTRDLEQIQAWADRDGSYSLFLLDQDLDLVAKGEEPRGSFSDFFVLNMDSALSAGVPVAEVRARLERLISLAEEGKPTSSFVRFMMGEDGPAGVRAYAEAKTGVDLTP